MSFGCPVDVDEWQRRNRAPLFPGMLNRWVLVRRSEVNKPIGEAELIREVKEDLFRWLEPTNLTMGRSDLFDSLKVLRIASERLFLSETAKRREQLERPPMLEAGGVPLWISIQFAYRGTATDIPWPVRQFGFFNSTVHCPDDTTWMLDVVGKPIEKAPLPPPTIIEDIKDTVSDITTPIKVGATGLLIGAGVTVGVLLYLGMLRAKTH